jgi:hypothetical protein
MVYCGERFKAEKITGLLGVLNEYPKAEINGVVNEL